MPKPCRPARLSRLLAALAVLGFAWGAGATVAVSGHYHVACVPHGFVHGDNTSDGSFFSRVEAGCGSTLRRCELWHYSSWVGDESTGGTTTTCNAWSRSFGTFTECASTAHTYSAGVFSNHVHRAHNDCT